MVISNGIEPDPNIPHYAIRSEDNQFKDVEGFFSKRDEFWSTPIEADVQPPRNLLRLRIRPPIDSVLPIPLKQPLDNSRQAGIPLGSRRNAFRKDVEREMIRQAPDDISTTMIAPCEGFRAQGIVRNGAHRVTSRRRSRLSRTMSRRGNNRGSIRAPVRIPLREIESGRGRGRSMKSLAVRGRRGG
ncbi:hypothetical protein FGB62_270g00 [Gracilaria domingensis]|nr:hypothetical protein FGB62_270g00 [Gracilaria domingensis]